MWRWRGAGVWDKGGLCSDRGRPVDDDAAEQGACNMDDFQKFPLQLYLVSIKPCQQRRNKVLSMKNTVDMINEFLDESLNSIKIISY